VESAENWLHLTESVAEALTTNGLTPSEIWQRYNVPAICGPAFLTVKLSVVAPAYAAPSSIEDHVVPPSIDSCQRYVRGSALFTCTENVAGVFACTVLEVGCVTIAGMSACTRT